MTKSPADVDKYIYIPELVLAVTGFLITGGFSRTGSEKQNCNMKTE